MAQVVAMGRHGWLPDWLLYVPGGHGSQARSVDAVGAKISWKPGKLQAEVGRHGEPGLGVNVWGTLHALHTRSDVGVGAEACS